MSTNLKLPSPWWTRANTVANGLAFYDRGKFFVAAAEALTREIDAGRPLDRVTAEIAVIDAAAALHGLNDSYPTRIIEKRSRRYHEGKMIISVVDGRYCLGADRLHK